MSHPRVPSIKIQQKMIQIAQPYTLKAPHPPHRFTPELLQFPPWECRRSSTWQTIRLRSEQYPNMGFIGEVEALGTIEVLGRQEVGFLWLGRILPG